MGRTKPANTPAESSLPSTGAAEPEKETVVSPGLSTLLQGPTESGARPHPQEPTSEAELRRGTSLKSLSVTLAFTDLLLAVLASWITLHSHGRLGPGEALLVIAAVVVGAWLGCCAVFIRR